MMDWNALVPALLTAAIGVLTIVGRGWKQRTTARLKEMEQKAAAQLAAQNQLYEQMRVQIETQQRTIIFLAGRVNELEAARAREYSETESIREETEQLRDEVRQLRQWGVAVLEQLESAKLTPPDVPPVLREAQQRKKRKKGDE